MPPTIQIINLRGLILTAVRSSGQRHRAAIHCVYAGGEVSPGAGTVIKYGNYMFYAKLDSESFLNHGHELYLTSFSRMPMLRRCT